MDAARRVSTSPAMAFPSTSPLDTRRNVPRGQVRGGLQDQLGAMPSDFVVVRERSLARLDDTELARVLRGSVDEYFSVIVRRCVDRAVRRARIDGQSDANATARVHERLDDVLSDVLRKGKLARKSPLALSRVLLDLFAMHTADRFEPGHPLDVILDVHRDLHAGNFEFVVDPAAAGTHRITLRKHDYETGGLGPRRADLDKSGMNTWLSAMECPLSEEHRDALAESLRAALRAEFGKRQGTSLFEVWRSGTLAEATLPKKVARRLEGLAAELEHDTRIQIAKLCVSEMALAYRDTIHALFAARERDPGAPLQKLVTADDIPAGKLRTLAERFQLRDPSRFLRRYVDEKQGCFARNELNAEELRPLGDTHRQLWARELAEKVPGFVEGGRRLVDIAERRGAGGASLGASDKLLMLVESPQGFELWYAKEPMATPFHYALPLDRLAMVSGVPMKLWQAQLHDGERTVTARQRQLGERAPEEIVATVGGIQYLVTRRDPTRKSFDVDLLDTVSLVHFSRIKGIEMANGHAQSWCALPELQRQLPRGPGRFGDLRDGLDEPPFVEQRVRCAEQDAAAMKRYADLLAPVLRKKRGKGDESPEIVGFKKRMRAVARARLEEARTPATTFKPHERR